jgi:hypothetical protein
MSKKKKSKRKKKKSRSGGTLSSMRGTIKSAAGSKTPKKKTWKGRIVDALLWVAVIVVAYFVLRSRCSR